MVLVCVFLFLKLNIKFENMFISRIFLTRQIINFDDRR